MKLGKILLENGLKNSLQKNMVPFSSPFSSAIHGSRMFATSTPRGREEAMKDALEVLKKDIPYEQDESAKKAHETPWRGGKSGQATALFYPRTTEQIQLLVKTCFDHRWPIIPQGGNTGVVYGSTPPAAYGKASPHAGKQPVMINLQNMHEAGVVDPVARTVTAQSGVILQTLREKMAVEGYLFAGGKMGSEGSANVGGATSTNAGGANYVRYGGMREQVLGLQAVLPDGRLLDTISNVEKDNTGFDLTPLLVGAEGTLGIITKVKLRLHALPKQTETTLVTVDSVEQATELLKRLKEAHEGELSAFELMSAPAFNLVADTMAENAPFKGESYPFYVLVELTSSRIQDEWNLKEHLMSSIEKAAESNLVTNAVFDRPHVLWGIRESITEKAGHAGKVIPNDVSLPIASIPEYLAASGEILQKEFSDLGLMRFSFGHLGDGNLHDNFLQREGGGKEVTPELQQSFEQRVSQLVIEHGGSPVAEHGVGRKTLSALEMYKDPVSLDVMYGIKRLLDPYNIMNPGVLFSEDRLVQNKGL